MRATAQGSTDTNASGGSGGSLVRLTRSRSGREIDSESVSACSSDSDSSIVEITYSDVSSSPVIIPTPTPTPGLTQQQQHALSARTPSPLIFTSRRDELKQTLLLPTPVNEEYFSPTAEPTRGNVEESKDGDRWPQPSPHATPSPNEAVASAPEATPTNDGSDKPKAKASPPPAVPATTLHASSNEQISRVEDTAPRPPTQLLPRLSPPPSNTVTSISSSIGTSSGKTSGSGGGQPFTLSKFSIRPSPSPAPLVTHLLASHDSLTPLHATSTSTLLQGRREISDQEQSDSEREQGRDHSTTSGIMSVGGKQQQSGSGSPSAQTSPLLASIIGMPPSAHTSTSRVKQPALPHHCFLCRLTVKQRLLGFAATLAAAAICLIMSFFSLAHVVLDTPAAFTVCYIAANTFFILSCCIFVGPLALRSSFLHPTRRLFSILYIGCLITLGWAGWSGVCADWVCIIPLCFLHLSILSWYIVWHVPISISSVRRAWSSAFQQGTACPCMCMGMETPSITPPHTAAATPTSFDRV